MKQPERLKLLPDEKGAYSMRGGKARISGSVVFSLATNDDGTVQYMIEPYPHNYPLDFGDVTIYELVTGTEFLSWVEQGAVMDYDGTLADIFVDGMLSNLGLNAGDSFCQGKFLVDPATFKKICSGHEVFVNWANR